MISFLLWYLASSILGWLAFPLAYRLFPALADRGYTLARAAGILVWAWVFWLLGVLGVLRNDVNGLLFAFLVLLGLSAWAFLTADGKQPNADRSSSILQWLKTNLRLVIVTEVLFLLAFAFMAFVRSANPDAVATEKPMELAFINATLRSPTLPPNDPWMSGYSISYYHFGYIMTAMFARITATPGAVAFNLMLALVFALAAIGAYGVLYNLLAATANQRRKIEDNELIVHRPSSTVLALALLAPLFLLILSNLEGFLEVIHNLGWFWPANSTSNFWTWLNIKDLSDPPSGGGWIPTRFWWWWRASRVVSDTDLMNNAQEIIDEFPFFSFLLGDLHPHVLALPFNMLGLGVALNIFLDGWRGAVNFLDYRLKTNLRDFLFAALVLGGLAFLNTWDILPAGVLMVAAYVLTRVRTDGWSWSRLEDAFLLGLPLAFTALLLYLPFYVGFSSQAGGILPNLINPTRGAQLWVMWGTLLIPLFAWLLWLTRNRTARPRYLLALALTLGLLLLLWVFSWVLAFAFARWIDPTFVSQYLTSQGQPDMFSFFQAALSRRGAYMGGLLTLAAVTWLSLAHLLNVGKEHAEDQASGSQPSTFNLQPTTFALLLTLLASLLVIAPDFVYLRDYFGYRINTVFKFYYQGWQLWSIAAAFGVAVLLQNLRGAWGAAWRVLLGVTLAAGLVYPALALPNKTDNFNPSFNLTLDGSAHLQRDDPEDAAAIHFLQGMPLGIVAEAVGGSYTNYARISTYTGDPAVLGWPWHEFQWRGNYTAHGTREADIKTLYETNDWKTAQAIIDEYHIKYIVIGGLERTTYNVNEAKFQRNLPVLFQAGTLVIYGAP